MWNRLYSNDPHIIKRRFVCHVADLINSWKYSEIDDNKFCELLVCYVLKYQGRIYKK